MKSHRLVVSVVALTVAGLALVTLRQSALADVPAQVTVQQVDARPAVAVEAGTCCATAASSIGLDGRIFLEIAGLPGESTHPDAEGLMDVVSWSWGTES